MMKHKFLSIPYIIWGIAFTIVPLCLIAIFSLCTRLSYGEIQYKLTLESYKLFLQPIYLKVLYRSIILAIESTIACLLVGYPMAYIISKTNVKKRNFLIILFILPLWTNFLLRTYAWMSLLREQGVVNQILQFLGFINKPLLLLFNDGAILMGMVYNFIPFMVLPIYTVLSKIDFSLIEASQDLGATTFETFRKVIFPLSFPGVVSGVTMVFMPAVSTFVISDLLGGGKTMLLGNLIENQFLVARNWQFGSAISMIMMAIVLLSMAIFGKQNREEGGGKFW